jgi:hypothetical protein
MMLLKSAKIRGMAVATIVASTADVNIAMVPHTSVGTLSYQGDASGRLRKFSYFSDTSSGSGREQKSVEISP